MLDANGASFQLRRQPDLATFALSAPQSAELQSEAHQERNSGFSEFAICPCQKSNCSSSRYLLDLFFVREIVRFVNWAVMQFKVVTVAAVVNCKHVQLDNGAGAAAAAATVCQAE